MISSDNSDAVISLIKRVALCAHLAAQRDMRKYDSIVNKFYSLGGVGSPAKLACNEQWELTRVAEFGANDRRCADR